MELPKLIEDFERLVESLDRDEKFKYGLYHILESFAGEVNYDEVARGIYRRRARTMMNEVAAFVVIRRPGFKIYWNHHFLPALKHLNTMEIELQDVEEEDTKKRIRINSMKDLIFSGLGESAGRWEEEGEEEAHFEAIRHREFREVDYLRQCMVLQEIEEGGSASETDAAMEGEEDDDDSEEEEEEDDDEEEDEEDAMSEDLSDVEMDLDSSFSDANDADDEGASDTESEMEIDEDDSFDEFEFDDELRADDSESDADITMTP
ncbi:unnamed protein product [Caenorhabditis bovis]|uniref:Uncharacterized protein n=1 Tax=Caenorhabditis bovis TaxID=2654633 RepID=A0A8S1EL90_9PELO|nr:unnamed protein product [Caenorhabditis bovis]